MLKGHLCSIYISPRRSLLHIKWMLKYWCVASSYECSKMTLASLWLNLPSIEAHTNPNSQKVQIYRPEIHHCCECWLQILQHLDSVKCFWVCGSHSQCLARNVYKSDRPDIATSSSANARPNETLSGEWVVFFYLRLNHWKGFIWDQMSPPSFQSDHLKNITIILALDFEHSLLFQEHVSHRASAQLLEVPRTATVPLASVSAVSFTVLISIFVISRINGNWKYSSAGSKSSNAFTLSLLW